jgi:hypothetical protein
MMFAEGVHGLAPVLLRYQEHIAVNASCDMIATKAYQGSGAA